MYQTTFQHTIQFPASLGMICKNLTFHLPWRQRKSSPLFTVTVFKATLRFFKETNVSENWLSDQRGIGLT